MTVDSEDWSPEKDSQNSGIVCLSAEAGRPGKYSSWGFGSNKEDLSNCRQSMAKPSLVIFWGKQERIH